MPIVFHRRCHSCETAFPPVSAGGFAVLVTDAEEDARRRAGETLPVVLHPFTGYVLDEFGLSFHKAAWGGQLVGLENSICTDCGEVTELRRLTAGGVTIGCGGCVVVAVLVVVVGAIAAFASGNPFVGSGLGIATGGGGATAAEWSASRWVRRRYPERAAALDRGAGCRHCGSRRCVRVGAADGRRFPCPQCGESAVTLVRDSN